MADQLCDVCTLPLEECVCNDPATLEKSHRGQARMAYRLADQYRGKLMHVFDLGWFAWDGTRWAEDTGQAQNAVLAVVRDAYQQSFSDENLRKDALKCNTHGAITGVLNTASTIWPLAATIDQLDADPYLLNCLNGTLELQTGDLRPHDPNDRITRVCNASFDESATSPRWESFLAEILPDAETRSYFQRFIGLSLVGTVIEHIFTIATGTGRNGKGVSYNAILHMLGDYGHAAEQNLFGKYRSDPNSPSPALIGLRGKRFVVVSETENGGKVSAALMKSLTGGDPITARRLNANPVTFTPSHTSLMVTNFPPRLPHNDPAVWRRVRVIPFDVVIPEEHQDPHLGARLESEADAILTWAFKGLAEYGLYQGLAEPARVQAATKKYESEQDDVRRFIEEFCVETNSGSTTRELFDAYQQWSKNEGIEYPEGFKDFAASLERHGFPVSKSNGRKIRRGLGVPGDNNGSKRSSSSRGGGDVVQFPSP